MPRPAALEDHNGYATTAAVLIRIALLAGPLTVAQAGCLTAEAAGLDWAAMNEAERKPWRARAMRIINALTWDCELLIAEDIEHGRLVFICTAP